MIIGTLTCKFESFPCTLECWITLSFVALATGAAMPIMMWLFQRVINGLVDIGKGSATGGNFTLSTDW